MATVTDEELLLLLMEEGVPWWLAREAIATTRMAQADDALAEEERDHG